MPPPVSRRRSVSSENETFTPKLSRDATYLGQLGFAQVDTDKQYLESRMRYCQGQVGGNIGFAFTGDAGGNLEYLVAEVAYVGTEDSHGLVERVAACDLHQLSRMIGYGNGCEDRDVGAAGNVQLALDF